MSTAVMPVLPESSDDHEAAASPEPAVSLGQLVERIKQEHEAVLQHMRQVIPHARVAGKLLNEAKAMVKHGDFMDWVEEQFGTAFKHDSANIYMRIDREWDTLLESVGRNSERVQNLTLRQALDLIRTAAHEKQPWRGLNTQRNFVAASTLDEVKRLLAAMRRAADTPDRLRPHTDQLRSGLLLVPVWPMHVRLAITLTLARLAHLDEEAR